MTKTRRMIGENLKYVDVVAEVIDARIPIASRNPDLDELVGGKPRVVILNRADQADPAASKVWGAYFRAQGISVLECDARSGAGVKQFSPVMRAALKEQIARWKEKGQVGRPVRAMVVGIPNVGKSTFINKVARKKSAKAGDRPGVTRGKQWITVDQGLELLDTPGILWPKFEDETIGLHLAFTGAVRDAIMDVETLACHLIQLLAQRKPESLAARFKLVPEEGMDGWALLEAGAEVCAYDPVAMPESQRRMAGRPIRYARTMYEAAEGADAVALITEWKEFRMPDWPQLHAAMRGDAIIDGRNIFDKPEVAAAGFRYFGIGK